MVEAKDLVLFTSVLIAAAVLLAGLGAADLPGSSSSNIVCSLPVVSDSLTKCSTEVAEKYNLETDVDVKATDVNAVFDEQTFSYETQKVGVFNTLNFLGLGNQLAFLGANDITVDFQLQDSKGVVLAYGSKFVGELGVFQRETVSFDVDNLSPGDYTVKYRMTYTPDFGVTEGVEQEKILEKNIRIPKKIQG